MSTLADERSSASLSDSAVRETFIARGTAHLLLSELSGELSEAGRKVFDQTSSVKSAKAALETYARERHIPTTPDAVRTEQKALTHYRESLLELFHAVVLWKNTRNSFERAKGQTARSLESRDPLIEMYEQLEDEHLTLTEMYHQRSSLVGADVTAVLIAAQKSRDVITKVKQELSDTQKITLEEAKTYGELTQALLNAQDQQKERREDMTIAVDAYLALCRQGLVSLAIGEEFALDDPSTATQSARMAAHLLAMEEWDEKAQNQARNDVDRQFRLLEAALSGPDWQPRAENDGSVLIVRLVHNGQPVDIPAALERIGSEISTRKSYLNDEERELFKEVLLGQLGEHLRRRRVEAARLVERMNALLKTRRTAAGMRLALIWEPDPDQSPEVRAALDTLDRQATKFLPDQARDQLINFLVGLVEAARDRQDVIDWKASLREVLDYRAWSRIRIRYQPAGDQPWTDLTNEKHQKGSGGEKAVSLQLPLFVAAAAHYEGAAPTAPRPVYLDEAFAGIDRPMRGDCMGLLTDLDLDVVMASHDEFGFHPEVPGVATYELFRDPEVEGVLTTPILWDGSRRHELTDPALIQDTPSSDGTLWEHDDDDDWEEPSDDDAPET